MDESGNRLFRIVPGPSIQDILSYLDERDLNSLSKVCRGFRAATATYLFRNPDKRYRPEWDYGKIDVGRSITVEKKKKDRTMRRNRSQYKTVNVDTFTTDQFKNLLTFYLPQFTILHIRSRILDEDTLEDMGFFQLKDCVIHGDQTLIVELEKCDLTSERLGEVLSFLSPVSLHFYGHFDRSIITGQAIPLCTQNLYIAEHPTNKNNFSQLDFNFFQRILNSWEETTAAGLILPRPDFEIRTVIRYIGNCRRLDIDHCHLTPSQVSSLQKLCVNRLGINQIIEFYNVEDPALLSMNDAPPSFFSEDDGLDRLANTILERRITHWGVHFLQSIEYGNAVVAQEIDNLTILSHTDIAHRDSLMSLAMHFYREGQDRRAVLPMTIANSGTIRDEPPPQCPSDLSSNMRNSRMFGMARGIPYMPNPRMIPPVPIRNPSSVNRR